MKKLLSLVLGFNFKEYPLWWKIMTISTTALIITYTYYINLYSHFYWIVLPIQYWLYFSYNDTKKDN